MFDWSEENKEKYYKKADILIRNAGYADFLKVDRNGIGVKGKNIVKVFLVPILRKGNVRKWNKTKKEISGFKDRKQPLKGKEQFIHLHGWIEMEL